MNRILVIHAGALGDFILTLPALAGLRARFPKASIHLMGRAHHQALMGLTGSMDVFHSIDLAPLSPLFVSGGSLPERTWAFFSRFDLVVSWFADAQGIFEANLGKVCRGTIVVRRSRPGPGYPRHVRHYFVETLAHLGVRGSDDVPRLTLPHGGTAYSESGPPMGPRAEPAVDVLIHPGSGSERKNWTAEGFARIAGFLAESLDRPPTLMAGPADEKAVKAVVGHRDCPSVEVLEGLTVEDAARRLAGASLFLGNDSGLSHLSAACGAPTVAVFGPTDPTLWSPCGDHVRVVGPGSDGRFPSFEDVRATIADILSG